MYSKIHSVFFFVGILLIKSSNADGDIRNDQGNILRILSSVAQSVARIADNVATGGPSVDDKIEDSKISQEFYLKTTDGRFVVLDARKQLGFVRYVDAKRASKFTATKVGCNVYGICTDGHYMSRCHQCKSDTNDLQTVKFHLTNSDAPWSRWTLVPAGCNGEFNLKIDGSHGYLTYKETPSGDNQLTLTTQLSDKTQFQFVGVPN